MTETARLPLAIIQTGVPPAPVAERHGGFCAMIRAAGNVAENDIEVIPVHQGATLRAPGSYRAAVITGSAAMVTSHEEWSERTAEWIRQAVDEGLPLFGICYGHQLLAYALGGTVGYHPRGREVGTQTIELLDDADASALTRGLPASFPAHLIHQQTVLELPPGARVLARSSHDPHQIVQYRDHVVSSQYHPEFDLDIMTTYLTHFAPALDKEGFDSRTLHDGLRPTPEAQSLLRRFLDTHVHMKQAA